MRQRRRLFKLLLYLLLLTMAVCWSSYGIDAGLQFTLPAGLGLFVEIFLFFAAALIIVLA